MYVANMLKSHNKDTTINTPGVSIVNFEHM